MSEPWIADFDSATAMARALNAGLRGHDFPNLGQSSLLRPLAIATNSMPAPIRRRIYEWSGWLETIASHRLSQFRAESVSRWITELYPKMRVPAVLIGSSNGALVHLATLLGIPWLPQTVLIPVSQHTVPADEPHRSLIAALPAARALLMANPELQLHHMHDANQDRLMIRHMTYFRVKRLWLGRIFEQWLRTVLAPGGALITVECDLSWPVTRVGPRHFFQHGGLGGISPNEYLNGGPRVRRHLKQFDAGRFRWDSPRPDSTAPEAEWGFAAPLATDARRFCERHGYRLIRLRFQNPEDLSPLVADLYSQYYEKLGMRPERLVVDSFILLDPTLTLRTASVPLWLKFAVDPSANNLERFLRARPPFDEIAITLFPHGTQSIGLTPVSVWQALARQARQRGWLIGIDPRKFPADFAALARFQSEFARLPQIAEKMPKLSFTAFQQWMENYASQYEVSWEPPAFPPGLGDAACAHNVIRGAM